MPTLTPVSSALALDIGGSHVTAAVVDASARAVLPSSRIHAPVPQDAPADVILEAWADAARHAAGAARVDAIGLAVPAPFEYATGVSRLQHKFAALYGLNVLGGLRACLAGTPLAALPVVFGNDADLFALGEWWAGAARGEARVIGVTLGTGLGAGFIDAGAVITDRVDVPPGGELWNTPYLDGIAEAYACGAAVTRAYAAQTGETASAAEVARRAPHDPAARAAFETLGRHLGAILRPHVAAFGASCVVVGGNVARAWPLFSHALQGALPGVACRPSVRFDEAALLGAAVLTQRAP
ncbi:ROK family protein [Deinococcus maricopensis]|uniref:ROK family protein n=1 Tax=Deinococcus maricopensis TaxID=309887 RepID=UPI001FE0BA28|nr:ROK family protein [Deinococcus maricopensis]